MFNCLFNLRPARMRSVPVAIWVGVFCNCGSGQWPNRSFAYAAPTDGFNAISVGPLNVIDTRVRWHSDEIAISRRINELGKEIGKNPDDATAFCDRALAWAELHELDKAIADASEAIRLQPGIANLFNIRGALWTYEGNYTRAVADLSEAIRLSPENAIAYSNRGRAHSCLGKTKAAFVDFDKALQLSPKDAYLYSDRGDAYVTQGEFDKALADYNEALRINATNVPALLGRGTVFARIKQFDRAVVACGEAIRLEPTSPSVYCVRGNVERLQGDFAKALAGYDEAVRLDQIDPSGFIGQAWVMATAMDAAVRNGRKAITAATAACDLTKWKDARSLQALAAAYAESGDFGAAVKWQNRLVDGHDLLFLKDVGSNTFLREQLKLYQAKKPYRETALIP